MANSPAFAATPKRNGCTWSSSTTANTKSDGTGTIGTDILLAYTAWTAGSYIDKIRLVPAASAAATATTGTVGRFYLSTKTSGSTTNADTRLYAEIGLTSQTADQTTSSIAPIEIAMGIRIAPNDTILFSMHHSAASNTVWQVSVIWIDY